MGSWGFIAPVGGVPFGRGGRGRGRAGRGRGGGRSRGCGSHGRGGRGGPGRLCWALDASPSSMGLGVPIVGPGATVGTVETRVPRAGLPGPITSPENFTKDQALQAWRDSRACRGLAKGSHDKGSRQGLVEASTSLAKMCSLQASSVSLMERTWVLRPPQSHGRASRSDASAVVAVSVYKADRKSTRLNSSHRSLSRMPSSA